MRKSVPLVIVCALATAGCGGGSTKEPGGVVNTGPKPASTGPSKTGTTSAPSAKKTTAVVMKNIKFVPANITVAAGTTIKWTNDDSVPHTVTKKSGPGPSFDSGTVSGGKSFSTKVTAPGKIGYVCTIHPGQSGTITVTQ